MLARVDPARKKMNTIFLIDVSGSMSDNRKMDSVNNAMEEAIESLKEHFEDEAEVEVFINVLSFGCKGEKPCQWMHEEMMPLDKFLWTNLTAQYNTPLGDAYMELDRMLSRDEFMESPGAMYAPVLVLITDGMPTNRKMAEDGLNQLLTNSWFVNADRWALGVDLRDNDDKTFLYNFTGNKQDHVFIHVAEASTLVSCVKAIAINSTMIGSTRLTGNPNKYIEELERIASYKTMNSPEDLGPLIRIKSEDEDENE